MYTTVITLVKDLLQAFESWVRPCCNGWNGLEFDETSILDNQRVKVYKLMISLLTYIHFTLKLSGHNTHERNHSYLSYNLMSNLYSLH